MKLFSDRVFFADFYSASTKIIVAKKDCNLWESQIKELAKSVDFYEFDYNLERSEGNIYPLNYTQAKDPQIVDLAPNFCLGFIALSTEGKQDLIALRHWWSGKTKRDFIPPLVQKNNTKDADFISQFWQFMYEQASNKTISMAQRISKLQKQYLELRSLHENMQNAFATVEDYLNQAKLPPLQLAFEERPNPKKTYPVDKDKDCKLYQLLPISDRGLATIDLKIAETYTLSVGDLTVSLKACEDKYCLAKWRIPYQQLEKDWLRLDIPVATFNRKRDVELIIEWNTEKGQTPTIYLGQKQIIPEFIARSDRTSIGYSIAFRAWTTLPGIRKVVSPYAISSINIDDSPLIKQSHNLGYLGEATLARLKEITPNLPTDQFPYIQVMDNGRKIQTHPREQVDPTIAMLPFAFSTGASEITATVVTEHPEGDNVEYAMAIIDEKQDPKKCFQSPDGESILAFSGWIEVEADIPQQIRLSLGHCAEKNYHIAIASRRTANGTTRYTWSRWLNFLLSA